MTRPDARPAGRLRDRWLVSLLSVSLAVGGAAAAAVSPSLATATPVSAGQANAPATDPAGNGDPEPPTDPPTPTEPVPTTAPPTVEPPVETPPPPTTGAPDPLPTVVVTSAAPLPTATRTPTPRPPLPTRSPPSTPAPGQPAPGRLGVRVTTGDVHLPTGFWNAASTTTTLQVTVTNTGGVTGQVGLAYTLPAGVTDAGTPGCAPAGDRDYRCGAWTTAPGARFSSLIRLRVSGDAWRRMPLSGTVTVTATSPGEAAPVGDDEGFAVLFPPGPPVPGIALEADELAFDVDGGPSAMEVRLGNTGTVDAAGLVEVVLPDGVSVPEPPAGCVSQPTTGRTRCEVGAVPAGRTAVLRLPVAATPEAQLRAPLSGGVVGQLDPRNGQSRRVQMSFRITAAAALATPVAGTPQPTGSQGVLTGSTRGSGPDGGLSTAQRTAIILIVVSGLLVVLALTLATTSLRRRLTGPPGGATGTGGGPK
ncbi:hypothetical protein GA0074694_2266 [Micromonospora inyonensis]|uniref:Uncharacterized protein n=1 Tax=Micromonospora inyonensis TaxID=47866 RepID=A0A1C6RM34_9ACTN|nr:hypothetical protein GA0074694_2266 [Micromonospora inyonensis]